MIVKCDAKGRVYIPKKMQERLSKEVFAVETPDGILLIPIPEDPVAELERLGKKLPPLTLKGLKEEIMKQAQDEMK